MFSWGEALLLAVSCTLAGWLGSRMTRKPDVVYGGEIIHFRNPPPVQDHPLTREVVEGIEDLPALMGRAYHCEGCGGYGHVTHLTEPVFTRTVRCNCGHRQSI